VVGCAMVEVLLSACSSAHLDPTTRAVSFYAQSPSSVNSGGAASTATATPTAPMLAQAGAGGQALAPVAPIASGKHPCASLPDPAPTNTDRWVELGVHFDKGKLALAKSAAYVSRNPHLSKRVMGRFAAELWIGCELIERVRFDFPLLAVDAVNRAPNSANFESSGQFDAVVSVPDSDRATRLELVDRANTERRILDWPLRSEK